MDDTLNSAAARQVLIQPTHQRPLLDFGDLWQFRYLFLVLVWRTLKVRYQQTFVGIAWAVLQPLLLTFVFTIIFGRLASMPTNGQPYPVFVLAGLIVWQFVAQSFQQATSSVVSNAHLVTRIYFPRILLLLSAVAASFFDFLCTLGLLVLVLAWYGVAPSAAGVIVFLPMLVLAIVTVLGLSLWLGALYVPFRDVGHLLPFMITLWMFLSPVIYPTSLLPPKYEFLYALNPLVVVIDTSRWAFAGGTPPPLWMIGVSTAMGVTLLLSGLWFFRRHEGTFADVV